MAEATGSHSISRRNFLKVSGAAAGALSVIGAGTAFTTSAWLSEAEAAEEANEYTACTYHQAHCGGMCDIKCTVRDGRLALIEPNKMSEDRYEVLCLKGLSEVQHVYSDHRIQTPLRRVGERGSSDFVQISWEEALDEIVEKVKAAQAKYGNHAVAVATSGEQNMPFLKSILRAQPAGWDGIDVGFGNGRDQSVGYGGGYAKATAEMRDWVNAKTLIFVGTNPLESSLPQARCFFEAKRAGAHIIVIDPHFTTTASKAHEWIPIEPGTDAALYLGMTSVILDEGLMDMDFIQKHTSLPYLVFEDTGLLVRKDNSEEARALTGAENPFYVIDEKTGKPAEYTKATAKVGGSVVIDGRKAVCAWDLLLKTQKPHTAEWAAEKTNIDAETIKRLAREYADGPSTLGIGWGGNDKMGNADIGGHALSVLAAVTGNISKPGANFGVYIGCKNAHPADLGAWPLPEEYAPSENTTPLYDMRYTKNDVRVFICNGDIFHQQIANIPETSKWLDTLDLSVGFDVYFTEGCKYCDIVLPMCSRFENIDEVGNVKVGYNHLCLHGKVLDPLWESKPEFWFEKEIAKRMGCEDILPKDSVELVKYMLANSPDPYIASITYEQLKENGGVWPLQGIEKPRMEFTDFVFNTQSQRVDLYYDSMVPFGQQLPVYEDCIEVFQGNPLREKYPFHLSNVRSRFRIHNQFNDASWIQQIHEPKLELNPIDMESRGLVTGDIARVFNDRGEFKCKVAENVSVRPGSIRIWEGTSSDFIVSGNVQDLTNDTTFERGYALMQGPVAPYSDTLVEIEKA